MTRSAAAFLITAIILFVGITMAKRGRGGTEPSLAGADSSSAERDRVLQFWDRYREATMHRTTGRTREAAAAYEDALALDGRHEDALYYSGNMLFELGEFSGAEAAWQRLIEVNETSARAHSRLGDLYLCYDRPHVFDLSAAEAQFRRAAEINPEETGPLLRLGESAVLRGDMAAAQTRLDEVLSSNSRSVEAHFLRGYIGWKTGKPAEAASHANRIVELIGDREIEGTGLNEGDTKSGAAMIVTPNLCRGIRGPLAALGRGAAPVTDVLITTLYRRADMLLTEAGLNTR